MKTTILAAALAAFAATGASALTQTLTIPAKGHDVFSAPLELGQKYEFTFFGTVFIDPSRLGDAEYYEGRTGAFHIDDSGFIRNDNTAPGEIGVYVNGHDVDLGPFSPDNRYKLSFTGLGEEVSFSYFDTNYGDNRTSTGDELSVSIAAVPLPAALPMALLALGGLGVVARRRKTA